MADTATSVVLVRAFDGKKLSLTGALRDDGIGYGMGMDGAATITLTLHDPDWALVNSGWFDRNQDGRLDAIDIELDSYWYRLVQVAPADDTLTLTFEDRHVSYLRNKFGHRVANRDSTTRAEFALSLVRSVKRVKIGFFTRELHVEQEIGEGETATTSDTGRKEPGIAKHASFKVKGVKATAEQKANAVVILGQADKDNAKAKATKSMVVAAIGEGSLKKSAVNGSHKGVFQSAQIPAAQLSTQAHHFLVGGRSFRAGGAIQAVKDHPTWTVGHIASYVEISDADGSFYDKYASEADAIIDAYGGNVSDGSGASPEDYQYTVAKDEDYWSALVRLAGEVNWRVFCHRGVVYFMDDYQLLRGKPQLLVDRAASNVTSFSYEVDQSDKFPQEATVTMLIPRFTVVPGDVLDVINGGTATGRWLLSDSSGTWHGDEVTLTLHQPATPKKEPAQSTAAASGSSSEGGGTVKSKAKSVSAQKLPYTWGGGHNNTFAASGSPKGYDCSGYVGTCLHAAGLVDSPMTSGQLMEWGQAGKGEEFTVYASTQHTFIIFADGGRADTSPQGGESEHGPRFRSKSRSTAGFTARHAKGH